MSWLNLDTRRGLVYRKQVMYEGDWTKANPNGDGVQFSTYSDVLNHWADAVKGFVAGGIDIPLSAGHDDWESPENKLGSIIGAQVVERKDGKLGLDLDVIFDSSEKRDTAIAADVSIGSPAKFIDGRGKQWDYPIRHVASTAAPVIPGLETWQAIAASFTQEDSDMSLTDLSKSLELDVAEDADLKTVVAAIEAKYTKAAEVSLSDAQAKFDAKIKELEAGKKEVVELSHNPLVVETICDNRKGQIDAFVSQGKLAAPVAKTLKEVHCSADAIGIELSHGGKGEMFKHVLDIAIASTDSKPLKPSGRTSDPADGDVTLSHGKGSSLVESMKAFAEQKEKELAAQRRR